MWCTHTYTHTIVVRERERERVRAYVDACTNAQCVHLRSVILRKHTHGHRLLDRDHADAIRKGSLVAEYPGPYVRLRIHYVSKR